MRFLIAIFISLFVLTPLAAQQPEPQPQQLTDTAGGTPQAKPKPPQTSDDLDFDEYVDCRKETAPNVDCRGSFEASYYLGGVADNFAGSELLNYIDKDAKKQGETTTRLATGFDFAYRLFGTRQNLRYTPDPKNPGEFILADSKDTPAKRFRWWNFSQLWVYGETLHSARSKELNCGTAANPTKQADLPACDELQLDKGTGEVIAIIKSASSLETYAGLRWEFLPLHTLLQNDEADRARMYLKAQYGAIAVRGGGDSADQSLYAIGALAVSGPLEGSYLEVGFGRNDLFHTRRGRRLKIDGFLSVRPDYIPLLGYPFAKSDLRIRPFAQLTADVDGGSGSDSYQTYFGFDFTFGKKSKAPKK